MRLFHRSSLIAVVVCAVGRAAGAQPPPAQPVPAEPAAPEPVPAAAVEPDPEPTAPAVEPAPTETAAASTVSGPLGRAFGLGIHAMITGPLGPALVYNVERFHIEGIVGFASNGETELAVGGRFWFHLHQTAASTLSIGGGLAFSSVDGGGDRIDPAPTADSSNVHLEGGAQIRFFMTPNVAGSASVGLGIVSGDADVVALTGQLTGAVGLTYFIF